MATKQTKKVKVHGNQGSLTLPPSLATTQTPKERFKERFKEPTVPRSTPPLSTLSFAKQTKEPFNKVFNNRFFSHKLSVANQTKDMVSRLLANELSPQELHTFLMHRPLPATVDRNPNFPLSFGFLQSTYTLFADLAAYPPTKLVWGAAKDNPCEGGSLSKEPTVSRSNPPLFMLFFAEQTKKPTVGNEFCEKEGLREPRFPSLKRSLSLSEKQDKPSVHVHFIQSHPYEQRRQAHKQQHKQALIQAHKQQNKQAMIRAQHASRLARATSQAQKKSWVWQTPAPPSKRKRASHSTSSSPSSSSLFLESAHKAMSSPWTKGTVLYHWDKKGEGDPGSGSLALVSSQNPGYGYPSSKGWLQRGTVGSLSTHMLLDSYVHKTHRHRQGTHDTNSFQKREVVENRRFLTYTQEVQSVWDMIDFVKNNTDTTLDESVLFLAVQLVCSCLQTPAFTTPPLDENSLYLLGVVCFWIADKLESIDTVPMYVFLWMLGGTRRFHGSSPRNKMIEMEQRIMVALNGHVWQPTVYTCLCMYLHKEGNLGSLEPSSSQNTFPGVNKGGFKGTYGSLVIHRANCLLKEQSLYFVHTFPPSLIAASLLFVARVDTNIHPAWTPRLEQDTHCSVQAMTPCIQAMYKNTFVFPSVHPMQTRAKKGT